MCYLCTRKTDIGTLAERLGNGLQNRVEQFDSARYLKKRMSIFGHPFLLRNAKPPPVATEKPTQAAGKPPAGGPRKDGRMTGKNKNAPHFTVGGITQ